MAVAAPWHWHWLPLDSSRDIATSTTSIKSMVCHYSRDDGLAFSKPNIKFLNEDQRKKIKKGENGFLDVILVMVWLFFLRRRRTKREVHFPVILVFAKWPQVLVGSV